MDGRSKSVAWRRKFAGGITVYYVYRKRCIVVVKGINCFQYDAWDFSIDGTDQLRITMAAAYLFSANAKVITMDRIYAIARLLGLYRGACAAPNFYCKDVKLTKEVKE